MCVFGACNCPWLLLDGKSVRHKSIIGDSKILGFFPWLNIFAIVLIKCNCWYCHMVYLHGYPLASGCRLCQLLTCAAPRTCSGGNRQRGVQLRRHPHQRALRADGGPLRVQPAVRLPAQLGPAGRVQPHQLPRLSAGGAPHHG